MRVIGEIEHPECKITLFQWNNRYLIKIEQGKLEQTFKIDQFDVTSETELPRLLSQAFMEQVLNRFREMGDSLHHALASL